MPSGRAWDMKNVIGSNLNNFARGICEEFRRGDISLWQFNEEMMPDTTDEYIGNWERAVGIPDDCFGVAATLEERRKNVNIKLSLLGLQTQSDFEGFADLMDVEVKVRSGIDHVSVADGGYGTELPVIDIPSVFPNVKTARFTIVCTFLASPNAFDYVYDFPFDTAAESLVKCVFTKAKPSNCDIYFTSN